MTKAKQLAAIYNAAQDEDAHNQAIQVICNHYIDEIFALLRQRNPSNDAGAIAILRELDNKWKAMARMTNGKIIADGFDALIKSILPEIGDAWKR